MALLRRKHTDEIRRATAGTAQIAGADVVALTKRKKLRHRFPFYAVFIGRPPGVYRGWDMARRAVQGVSGNCVKGYINIAEAQGAFDYADARGWIGGADGQQPMPRVFPESLDPHGQAPPNLTPLCPSDKHRAYYCVFRGQRPGIYASM